MKRVALLAAVLVMLGAGSAQGSPGPIDAASAKGAIRDYLQEEQRTGGNQGFDLNGCERRRLAIVCAVTEYGVFVEVPGAECPCDLSHRIAAWKATNGETRLRSSLFGVL